MVCHGLPLNGLDHLQTFSTGLAAPVAVLGRGLPMALLHLAPELFVGNPARILDLAARIVQ